MKWFLAMVGAALIFAAPALADDAIAPVDGAVVGSRPIFAFDFLYGTAEVELSRSPDLKASGPEVGAFVSRVIGDFQLLYAREPPDGLMPFAYRIEAGRYFWHTKVRNDGGPDGFGTEGPWGPVRTLTVRDEPIAIEGWTARKNRLRQIGSCKRLRIRGTIAFNDNDRAPQVQVQVVVRNVAGRILGRISGSALFGSASYDGIICTAATKVRLTPYLRDRGRHLVSSPPRLL